MNATPTAGTALLQLEAWIATEKAAGRKPSTADELLWLAGRLDAAQAQPQPAAPWEPDYPPVSMHLHERLLAMADVLDQHPPHHDTDPVLQVAMIGVTTMLRGVAADLADDYQQRKAADLAEAKALADAERDADL